MKGSNHDRSRKPITASGSEHVDPAAAGVSDSAKDLSDRLKAALGREPLEIEAVAARLGTLGFAVAAKNLENIARAVHPSTFWLATSALFVEQDPADASFCGGMTLKDVGGRGWIYVVLTDGHAQLTLHADMQDLLTAWPSFGNLIKAIVLPPRSDSDAQPA